MKLTSSLKLTSKRLNQEISTTSFTLINTNNLGLLVGKKNLLLMTLLVKNPLFVDRYLMVIKETFYSRSKNAMEISQNQLFSVY